MNYSSTSFHTGSFLSFPLMSSSFLSPPLSFISLHLLSSLPLPSNFHSSCLSSSILLSSVLNSPLPSPFSFSRFVSSSFLLFAFLFLYFLPLFPLIYFSPPLSSAQVVSLPRVPVCYLMLSWLGFLNSSFGRYKNQEVRINRQEGSWW